MSGEESLLRKIVDKIPDDTQGKLELSVDVSLIEMETREIREFADATRSAFPDDETARTDAIKDFMDRITDRAIDADDIDFPPAN